MYKQNRLNRFFSVSANRDEAQSTGRCFKDLSYSAVKSMLALFAFALSPVLCVAGEPYVPDDDSAVLEVLPDFLVGGRDKFVEIQDRLRENPDDELLARRAARLMVTAGEEYSDPRFFGLARTVIDPWWTRESVPVQILLLRAKLKEKNQLYDEAITDLIQVSSQDPTNSQALIDLARLYSLQGQYGDARVAAKQLKEIAGDVAYQVCVIPIDVRTGHSKTALEEIERISPDFETRFAVALTWLRRWQAELAKITGNSDQADKFYRQGIDEDPTSVVIKLAYADFLIQRGDCESVIDMFPDQLKEIRVLLRVAIAARKTGHVELANQYTEKLTAHFDAMRQRGDGRDQGIAARYYLDLLDKPKLALEEALANWEKRKGLDDSQLVLRAALAAGQPWDAREVKRFLRTARTEDVISQRLISELESQ